MVERNLSLFKEDAEVYNKPAAGIPINATVKPQGDDWRI